MKKAFYMMAAAAIALSSCSSEETTDVAKSSTITFRTSVGLNSRGAETTTQNIDKMWVSAFYQKEDKSFFLDQEFTKENDSKVSLFIPTSPYFWQDGRTYQFIAISPKKAEWPGTLDITRDNVICQSLTPAENIADQKDLVIDSNGGGESIDDGSGIPLTLKHILSQIQIKVKNGNENLLYHIAAVRINNVVGSKKFTFTNSTRSFKWENTTPETAATTTYNLTFGNKGVIKLDGKKGGTTEATLTFKPTDEETAANKTEGGAMILPQTVKPWDGNKVIVTEGVSNYNGGAYISLYLNVKTATGEKYMYPDGAKDENTYGWVAIPIPTTEWMAGNKYIYTLDMSTGCGKVDPVDPGENVNPGGTDTSKPGKDPNKGENIFGKAIKFKVEVQEWATDNNIKDIDSSTGNVKP